MDDELYPAIHAKVIDTPAKGVRVLFRDYKIGDAALLIVNQLEDESISFSQVNEVYVDFCRYFFFLFDRLTHCCSRKTQILPSKFHTFYTWTNPQKPRQLIVSCGNKIVTIEANVCCIFSSSE